MIKKQTLAILFCVLLACKQSTGLKQVTDGGITLQVINIKSADSLTTAFKVRVVLNKAELKEEITPGATHALLYKADSMFFIKENGRAVYPQITQPVANGVANAFEYLVDFDKMATGTDIRMVYRDKYITKRDYQVKLN